MVKYILFTLLCGTFVLAFQVNAQEVQVVDIPNPEFTEVQALSDGSWHVVSDLGALQLPLKGTLGTGNGPDVIVITLHGVKYGISRADVKLSGEKIVTSACKTVPITISQNSTTASVKGAGELCNR